MYARIIQVFDMYLNVQILGTQMPGIDIELSLKVCTVSIKIYIARHICICISAFVFAPHMQDCSDM
jgi:hypothetical protein